LIGEDCPKGENTGKLQAGKRYTKDQRSWKNSRPEKRYFRENSCLRTGTLSDSKGFCENSGLGKGISGKTSGFIRETYSRPERVW
jgi:hypothetical protein